MNIALLSRWHVHADDYANDVKAHPELQIALVWDEEEARGEEWANELGVPFEKELKKVLENPDIDAVVVTTPTNLHKEVIIAAANHQKHIFSEKVLAFTVEDCEEIYEAIERNHVKFMLSLPKLTDPAYLFAQQALDEGKIGQLTTIRCRMAHNGAIGQNNERTGWLPERFYNEEQTGGGALIDLGAHPIYLLNRLAGGALALQAKLQATKGLGVDDQAVVLIEYESGALGIVETSFISAQSPFQLELYGTEGSIMIEDQHICYHFGDGLKEAKDIQRIETPIEQWVKEINDGITPTITKDDIINLTRINELAIKSNKENKRVEI